MYKLAENYRCCNWGLVFCDLKFEMLSLRVIIYAPPHNIDQTNNDKLIQYMSGS